MLRRAESSSHCHVFGRLLVLRNVEACTCDKTIRPAMLLERSLTPKTAHPAPKPSATKSFQKIPSAGSVDSGGKGAKAGSHDTHDVTWPRCDSLGHRPENSCCGGRKVRRTAMSSEDLVLRNVEACTCDKTIRPAMLLERSLTPKTAHPAPKPSATKSFQKIPSAGIGARKVSSY